MPTKPACGSRVILYMGLMERLVYALGGSLLFVSIIIEVVLQYSFFYAGAIGGALFSLICIGGFYWRNCFYSPDGEYVCTSGIIYKIVHSFNSTADYLFPFSAEHDRVDVAVNPLYWPLVETVAGKEARYVHCTEGTEDIYILPILSGFYKSDVVCAAGLGSIIGGTIGAVGGIFLGAFIAGLMCVSVFLCFLALLVAAIVAALITLIGACIGGNVAKTIAEGRALGIVPDNPLLVGNCVATFGNLVVLDEFDGAVCYWFVDPSKTQNQGPSYKFPPFTVEDVKEVFGCPEKHIVL